MIMLDEDVLFFQGAGGEGVPLRADMICIEVCEGAPADKELVRHAVTAVFHYFRHDLGRTWVTFGEFSVVLESVLKELGLNARIVCEEPAGELAPVDLEEIARESNMSELVFFSKLRPVVRSAAARVVSRNGQMPVLRFTRLRQSVKTIFGTRRWTPKCQLFQEELLGFLRATLMAEVRGERCILMVD